MDFISIALSIIGIAQNIRLKKTKEEKIDELKAAYEKILLIFRYLKDAKTAHDEFQKFDMYVGRFYKKLIDKAEKTSLHDLHEELTRYIGGFEMLSKSMANSFEANLVFDENSSPPEIIREYLNVIYQQNPQFVEHINQFKYDSRKLTKFSEEQSKDLESLGKLMSSCKHRSKQVLLKADIIILNTVPILDFIHLELDRSINSIQ